MCKKVASRIGHEDTVLLGMKGKHGLLISLFVLFNACKSGVYTRNFGLPNNTGAFDPNYTTTINLFSLSMSSPVQDMRGNIFGILSCHKKHDWLGSKKILVIRSRR
jgi:hypothetical protein